MSANHFAVHKTLHVHNLNLVTSCLYLADTVLEPSDTR